MNSLFALLINLIGKFFLNIFIPFFLKFIPGTLGIFIVQLSCLCFCIDEFPASPVFVKQFSIFKRATIVLFVSAIAQCFAALVWLGPIQIAIKYFGYFAWLIILLPMSLIATIGTIYFKKLEDKSVNFAVQN